MKIEGSRGISVSWELKTDGTKYSDFEYKFVQLFLKLLVKANVYAEGKMLERVTA